MNASQFGGTVPRRVVDVLGVALTSCLAGCGHAPTVADDAGPGVAPIIFSGGHETDSADGGRPIALIAGALRVTPDVFREAFRGVTPARGRGPTGEEARRNKEALLRVLGPHGVTNERLDEVSDYYRYRPERGEMWPTVSAEAYAMVENGEIQRIVVTKGGSGYSSPPLARVNGFENFRLEVKIEFDKDFEKNGAVGSIEVVALNVSTGKR